MNNIIKELHKIEKSIPEDYLFLEYGIITLGFFEFNEYNSLIRKLHDKREKMKLSSQRETLIPIYKKVFYSQKKKLRAILKNITNNQIVIEPDISKEEMMKNPVILGYKNELSVNENLIRFSKFGISKAIDRVSEEIYLLTHHPSVYYNVENAYIGGDFGYRYRNEIIIYKTVYAMQNELHHFLTFKNDSTTPIDQRTLLNLLAYLNGRPNFEFLKNKSMNEKLNALYPYFDLLDCIRLRTPKYLEKDTDKHIYLELPIIKNKNNYHIIVFKEMPHKEIFDLYHASLKQFEPLPRCVFLYRVFEYAATYHYKPTFNPYDYKPEDALNYYLEEAMKYNPNPLYYIYWGKEKLQIKNFFTVLKKHLKQIFIEWSINPYLKNKSKGEIIYLTGRNFTAHGGSRERNMQYDYSKNYIHINNINIALELIARYVIELLNPNIRNVVERRTEYYLANYSNTEK